jgi:hypothetical protein
MKLSQRIFVLGPKQKSQHLGIRKTLVPKDMIHCGLKQGHQRSANYGEKFSIEMPLDTLTLSMYWTWMFDCLIRHDLSHLFASNGITGFRTQQVKIKLAGERVSHDFEMLKPIGWGGGATEKSGVKLLESCCACGYLRYSGVQDWRQLIDWTQWDGSDIFIAWPLPKYILITDRVRDLLETNLIEEMTITSLEKMAPQDSDLTPGRVSDWLPLDKIRSLAIHGDIA